MYARVHRITNVGGRINYVTNKEDNEEVIGIKNTADSNFWSLLAKENQEQFLRSTNSANKKFKAIEAQELVVGLPDDITSEEGNIVAEMIATSVKSKFKTECYVAIHSKKTFKDGQEVRNVHAHIINAERELLPEPIHFEEKRATRNYYFDAAGKKCKKADAVKTTLKGTVTQEAYTRYFSDKISFYSLKKFDPIKESVSKIFGIEDNFDIEKHFPQKHFGKNNPKEKYIKEYNELVKQMNSFFDELDKKSFFDSPAKQIFCERINIKKRFSVENTAAVREDFEKFKAELERSNVPAMDYEQAQELYITAANYQKAIEEIEKDIRDTEVVLQANPDDFVNYRLSKALEGGLERKYGYRVDNTFLEYLNAKLSDLKEALANVLEKIKQLPGALREKFGRSEADVLKRSEDEKSL